MKETKKCPDCGVLLPKTAAFCSNCGKALNLSNIQEDIQEDDEELVDDSQLEDEEDYDEEEFYEGLDQKEVEEFKRQQKLLNSTLFGRILRFLENRDVDMLYAHNVFATYDFGFLVAAIIIPTILTWLFVGGCINERFGNIILGFALPAGIVGIIPMLVKYSNDESGKYTTRMGLFALYIVSHILGVLYFVAPIFVGYYAADLILICDGKIGLFITLAVIWAIAYWLFFFQMWKESKAYSDWDCAIANGNYEYLHSNRFRYRTSFAEQDFDQQDTKIFRTCKCYSILCGSTTILWALLGLIFAICGGNFGDQ